MPKIRSGTKQKERENFRSSWFRAPPLIGLSFKDVNTRFPCVKFYSSAEKF